MCCGALLFSASPTAGDPWREQHSEQCQSGDKCPKDEVDRTISQFQRMLPRRNRHRNKRSIRMMKFYRFAIQPSLPAAIPGHADHQPSALVGVRSDDHMLRLDAVERRRSAEIGWLRRV